MDKTRDAAEDLLRFIDAAPSPWHAVAESVAMLVAAGFERLWEGDSWRLLPGHGYYVIRDGSALIAFLTGAGEPARTGFRIVGAHTDSPGFRVKPRPAMARADVLQLGVEVYGGPIVATFADRDLTLAGRALVEGKGIEPRLVRFQRPLLRLAAPAIHLNREVNEQGLRFDLQDELPMILAGLDGQLPPDRQFRLVLAGELGVEPDAIRSWELAVADTQIGAFYGLAEEFIASARLDNLASCHASVVALAGLEDIAPVSVCAMFDHEEVGSLSYKGAEGSFLSDSLSRICEGLNLPRQEDRQRALARSLLISADMAHASHPNYPRFHDEQHPVRLNAGPVIKINAKQRYATDAVGEAFFYGLCEAVGVEAQRYVHRNNLPCGSTIGPISAARLGLRTVDVGNPMLSMHSARESAGAKDHEPMIRVLSQFYATPQLPTHDEH